MNVELLKEAHPHDDAFPDHRAEQLEEGIALTCAFNNSGNLLAVGCHDGRVAMFDFITMNLARLLVSHVRPITSVSWSRGGRYLISASLDGQAMRWDLQDRPFPVNPTLPIATADVGHPIASACTHPTRAHLCVVCPQLESPYLIDFNSDIQALPATGLEPSTPTPTPTSPSPSPGHSFDPDELLTLQASRKGTHCAAFSPDGQTLYLGTVLGLIVALDTQQWQPIRSWQAAHASAIKSISLYPARHILLCNCGDRTIRTLDLTHDSPSAAAGSSSSSTPADPGASATSSSAMPGVTTNEGTSTSTTQHQHQHALSSSIKLELKDPINNLQWKAVSISPSGDYIVAAGVTTRGAQEHRVYCWNMDDGTRYEDRILEHPKDSGVTGLAWHPLRPAVLVSVSTSGCVYVWKRTYVEKWSAYQPGFEELEQNEVYVENEDEFDEQEKPTETEAAELRKRKLSERVQNEQEDVDIASVEHIFDTDPNEHPGLPLFHVQTIITPDQVAERVAAGPNKTIQFSGVGPTPVPLANLAHTLGPPVEEKRVKKLKTSLQGHLVRAKARIKATSPILEGLKQEQANQAAQPAAAAGPVHASPVRMKLTMKTTKTTMSQGQEGGSDTSSSTSNVLTDLETPAGDSAIKTEP